MGGIGALGITFIGIAAVFLILLILSEVIRLIGVAFGESVPQPQTISTGSSFADLDYFKKREQDVAIITTIMKKMGCTGSLKVKRIK